MPKEDRDSDKRAADLFMRSLDGDPEDMTMEDKVEVLRGVCCFLLRELQKTYMHIMQHENIHDSILHKNTGDAISKTEDMMAVFFPDFLTSEDDDEDEDESTE